MAIDVKDGKVYINDKVLTEKYLDEAPAYNWSSTELTPDGIVPEGHYLVLGDNRNNSYDSHYWGFVPKDKIVGKATIRFWPIDRLGGIDPQPNYQSISRSYYSLPSQTRISCPKKLSVCSEPSIAFSSRLVVVT